MNNRAFVVVAILLSALIALQLRSFFAGRRGAIVVRATNAQVPIPPEGARVFIHPAGRRDRAEAEGAPGESIDLHPGHYDVRVWYSRSKDAQERWVRGATVAEGRTEELEADFSAGELAVSAPIGGARDDRSRIRIQVFAEGSREQAAAVFDASERIVLAEGKYALRAALMEEGEEREVAWLEDVIVRAGMTTESQIEMERGTLEVAATNAGVPLPVGAVKLKVFRRGDAQREIVAEGVAGLPLGLGIGEYEVEAEWSLSANAPRPVQSFALASKQKVVVNAVFSSGVLLAHAVLPGGESLDGFKVYVYAYDPEDHTEPIAYAPAGRALLLAEGHYDLLASFVRSHDRPNLWRRGIEIRQGVTSTVTFTFDSCSLIVEATAGDGSPLAGDNVFVEVHLAGTRARPVVIARSGEEMILRAGRYDVRAEDSRHPESEAWLRDLVLPGGGKIVRPLRLSRSPALSASSP